MTSSIEGASRPCITARARHASISAWLARGPGAQATCSFTASRSVDSGRAAAGQAQDRLQHAFADGNLADQALGPAQGIGRDDRLGQFLGHTGGRQQHLPFRGEFRIADIDLQQEPVELRFRQGIRAFLFQRVLGGEHMERLRQGVILTGDRNAMFLHRLQQRRLGARAGAVDFVRHQQLAEDRPFDEPEGAPPAIAFLEDFGAQYVGRHQVRRALDPFGVQAKHDRQRLDQLGLGQARHADQQHMAAGQQRDQGLLDHFALAEYYAFHAGPDPVQDFAELLQFGDGLVRRIAVTRFAVLPVDGCAAGSMVNDSLRNWRATRTE